MHLACQYTHNHRLSGLNSTDKSSLLQSLLLLCQSNFQGSLLENRLLLNSDLVNIGTVKDRHASLNIHISDHIEWIKERIRDGIVDGDDIWYKRE